MKQTIGFLLLALFFVACKVNPSRIQNNCQGIEGKFVSVIDKDTAFINELQFHCVRSALLSKKVLFDKFGKWSYSIYPETNRNPALFWEDIDIFENDTTKYTIVAYGKEEYTYIYTSFMVLDTEGNDGLKNANSMKDFKTLFDRILKSNDNKNKVFYEVYWKSIDPEIWKKIKDY